MDHSHYRHHRPNLTYIASVSFSSFYVLMTGSYDDENEILMLMMMMNDGHYDERSDYVQVMKSYGLRLATERPQVNE